MNQKSTLKVKSSRKNKIEQTKRLPNLEEFRKSIKIKGKPLSQTVIEERDE